MRFTEYHCDVAVIRDKELLSKAMAKLAAYEDIGLEPEDIITTGMSIKTLSETITILVSLSRLKKDIHKHLESISTNLKVIAEFLGVKEDD